MVLPFRRLAVGTIPTAAAVLLTVPAAEGSDGENHYLLRGAGFYGQTVGLGDVEEDQSVYGGEASIGVGGDSFLAFNDGESRFELEYRYLTGEEEEGVDSTVHDFALNYVELFGTGRVRPLAGVGTGPSTFTATIDFGANDLEIEETGLVLQGFGGVSVAVAENVDLEFRVNYAYRFIEAQLFGQEVDLDLDTLTVSAGVTVRL